MNAYAQVFNWDAESIGQIPRWKALTVRRTVNNPAEVILTLDGRDPAINLFGIDFQTQLWRSRRDLGIAPYKELDCLYRSGQWSWDARGQLIYQAKLYGLESLLQRRVLLGGDEGYYTGIHSAETALKATVAVQCGLAGTRTHLDIAVPGLAVVGSAHRGAMCTGYQIGTPLLTHLQTKATTYDMGFHIVSDSPYSFLFDCWPNPYGIDRTAIDIDPATGLNSAGSIPVIFSLKHGNTGPMVYSSLHDNDGTVAIEPTSGLTAYGTGYGDSPLNHWETVVTPETDQVTTSSLEYALQQLMAKETVSLDALQTRGCAYGKDYFLGDWVTVAVQGPNVYRELTQIITGVIWTVEYKQNEPVESISIDLTSGMVIAQDPVKETLGNLIRRVKYLELSA